MTGLLVYKMLQIGLEPFILTLQDLLSHSSLNLALLSFLLRAWRSKPSYGFRIVYFIVLFGVRQHTNVLAFSRCPLQFPSLIYV